MSIRIVVADDHPIVLKGIEQVLRQGRDIEVVAACGNGGEALAEVGRRNPDVLVLDLRTVGKSGLQTGSCPSPSSRPRASK